MLRIAILLSTFNGERYIGEQLGSIAAQAGDFEKRVIIRDDGSDDGTFGIIDQWRGELDIEVIRGKNLGPEKSFRELVVHSGGYDFYAFCDQDDIWDEDKLEVGVKRLLERGVGDEVPQLFFSNARFVNADNTVVLGCYNVSAPILEPSNVMVWNPAIGCSMLFNSAARDLFAAVPSTGNFMHDKLMLMLCLIQGVVCYDHEARMSYRQHSANVAGKEGDFSKRIRQAFGSWFKSGRGRVSRQAGDLLGNPELALSGRDRELLGHLLAYRGSLRSKFVLMLSSRFGTPNRRANRSFKIRALLNLV